MVKPSCSNFRVITATLSGVRIFRIFTVYTSILPNETGKGNNENFISANWHSIHKTWKLVGLQYTSDLFSKQDCFFYTLLRMRILDNQSSLIWASSWDYGTYPVSDQRRLRRAWASAQSRQSLRCSRTWSMDVEEGSHQKSDIQPHWMAAHACLKNEYEKCHNLMINYVTL